MAYPIPVPREVEEFLTMANDQELHTAAGAIINDPNVNQEVAACLAGLCYYELELRQQEPLWRKTSRGAKRWWAENGNGATKVGVGLLLGVLLGVGVDHSLKS